MAQTTQWLQAILYYMKNVKLRYQLSHPPQPWYIYIVGSLEQGRLRWRSHAVI